MTNETETLTSGIDPASFSSVIKPTNDLFRYVNGPWIDTYRLPDDRSRYGSFDKLAEDAENQVRDILDADDCPAVKSEALYRSFLNTDAIEAAGLDPIRDELDLIDSAIARARHDQPSRRPRSVRLGRLRRPGRPGPQHRPP